MAIFSSKAVPTWTGVHVQHAGTTLLVPWRDAVDLRVVRQSDRWIRIGFDLGDARRARALRTRALRNLWRSGEPVVWHRPTFVPEWLEKAGMLIPISASISVGVACAHFTARSATTMSETIRREGLSWWLAASMWTGIVLVALFGLASLASVWLWIMVWRREPLSATVYREMLTLVRRDRTFLVHASEVARIDRSIMGIIIITKMNETIPLWSVHPAVYEPWTRSLAKVRVVQMASVPWFALVFGFSGILIAGANQALRGPHALPHESIARESVAILILTLCFGSLAWWSHRLRFAHAE